MSSQFDDKLRVCRIILTELRDQPCRWTPLFKATLSHSPTPWKFKSALEWLCAKGYVKHENRRPYEITGNGRSFLSFLLNSVDV
jgi:predicted transcriptional regulator